MKLKVKWSKSVKVSTWATSIIILLAIILLAYQLLNSEFNWIGISAIILLVTSYMISFAHAPKYITLDNQSLTIIKTFTSTKIPTEQIVDIFPFGNYTSQKRRFGSGGPFGYIGMFSNKEVGRYISYVGDYKDAFYIKLKNDKIYLISCEQSSAIIEKLKNLTDTNEINTR